MEAITSYETESASIFIENRGTLNGRVILDASAANDVVVNRGTSMAPSSSARATMSSTAPAADRER
jgi:hypothetical protein